MGHGNVFNTEKVQEMIALYRAGWADRSTPALARRYGVNHTTIFYHLKKHGVWTRKVRKPRPPKVSKPRKKSLWNRAEHRFDCCGSRSCRRHKTGCASILRQAPPPQRSACGLNQGKTYLEYLADACRRGDKTIQSIVPGGRYASRGATIRPIEADQA